MVSGHMMNETPAQGLLDWFAPAWALRAEKQIADYPNKVRIVVLLVSFLIFSAGFVLMVGGGYWSIQGVRHVLTWLGVSVALAGIPAAPWWLIPISNTAIQITARRIPEIRRIFWIPSLWFDGATTGAFLAVLFLPGMQRIFPACPAAVSCSFSMQYGAILAAGLSAAILGMLIAIVVEHIVLGALVLVRACWPK